MTALHTALVIEHDPLLREMISEAFTLHRPGLSTVAVDSPSDAMPFIQEGQIDLVIAGLGLDLAPAESEALIEALAAIPEDIPLLARRDTLVHDIALPSFLQLLHHDRKTCTLVVVSGNRHGHLFMSNGELIHASLPGKNGRDAAIEILGWPNPAVRVVNRCRARQTIHQSITSLLLDWSVIDDHTHAGLNA